MVIRTLEKRTPHTAPLETDEVHLWTVELTPQPGRLQAARAALSAPELAALDAGLLHPARRERLTLARGALRAILGAYLGQDPRRVAVVRDSSGRPRLHGPRELAFSLSHARSLAAVAVTRRAAVGVDVEERGRGVRPGLYRRVLGPQRAAAVLALPTEIERESAFLVHWTAREARGKARGLGLADRAARDDPSLSLQRLDPSPTAVGAVAASGGPWRLRLLRYRG